MKKQKTYFLENITLSELGKRNIQAKRVYSNGKAFFCCQQNSLRKWTHNSAIRRTGRIGTWERGCCIRRPSITIDNVACVAGVRKGRGR